MFLFKKTAFLSFFVMLSACNIRPLYYNNASESENSKSFIHVAAIKERIGQELRNMLSERLHFIRTIKNPVSITIGLTEEKEGLGYNPDLSSSVMRVTLIAKTVVSNKTGFYKVLTTEKSDIVTIPSSIYASLVNEEDIKRKILREISNDIVQRITTLQKDLQ